jgi:release factor glutamine methyltransferase
MMTEGFPEIRTKRLQGMNCAHLLKEAESQLDMKGVPTPALDAQVLLAHCIGRDRSFLHAHPECEFSDAEARMFRLLVARRMNREPVAYITGMKEFWSLPFAVNRNVLIPRPDTEIVVEAALNLFERREKTRILEIGTGSGAISIAIATEREKAIITATDYSREALAVAVRNALNNGAEQRITFLQGDLFTPVTGRYDIIVSNPPYISEGDFDLLDPEVREHEPREALIAGPHGTEFHGRLVEGAPDFLADGGWLVMELGVGQKKALEKMMHENGYCDIVFDRDYAGIERVVRARMRR